mmetsp:Transcript_3143/g.11999  ORF Transcript_3143/g.11999 Transcript_3143/m.11999 type:complete len:257 (-) Transcript_3143:9-779(-)
MAVILFLRQERHTRTLSPASQRYSQLTRSLLGHPRIHPEEDAPHCMLSRRRPRGGMSVSHGGPSLLSHGLERPARVGLAFDPLGEIGDLLRVEAPFVRAGGLVGLAARPKARHRAAAARDDHLDRLARPVAVLVEVGAVERLAARHDVAAAGVADGAVGGEEPRAVEDLVRRRDGRGRRRGDDRERDGCAVVSDDVWCEPSLVAQAASSARGRRRLRVLREAARDPRGHHAERPRHESRAAPRRLRHGRESEVAPP